MSITFPCPCCGRSLSFADDTAGKSGQCPDCKEIVRIPGEHSEPIVRRPVEVVIPQPVRPSAVKIGFGMGFGIVFGVLAALIILPCVVFFVVVFLRAIFELSAQP